MSRHKEVRDGDAVTNDFRPEVSSKAARTHAEASVPAPIEALPGLCSRAVQQEPRFSLRSSTERHVELRRRVNWKTWGELVSVDFKRLDEDHTLVSIAVEPLLGTTLFDYGQGERDATDLLRAIWQLARS